ncbi:hypothetical protein GCM10027435_08880 [Haloparvum alkalitolerans]|uniref:DUF7285 family protein n=1 Tax=Haloparvum alkalitolerans TaxID=1042953 RepID=UPI003CEC49B4
MSRLSDRGWADPVAALVALAAVGAGMAVYVGVLHGVDDAGSGGRPADILDRVHDATADGGVARPANLTVPDGVVGEHRAVRARLSAGERRWTAGDPRPPEGGAPTHTAQRSVPVRTAPGENSPGTLRVVVWT